MDVTRTRLPGAVIGMLRDGTSTVVEAPTRPIRLDGHTFGVADIDEPPPHDGEMHPDGDELLYLISGSAAVLLEEDGTQETIGAVTRHVLEAGDAFVVPRGHWHRIETIEPYRLVHLTPGPGDGHRPLRRDRTTVRPAQSEALDELEALLVDLRSLPGLTERSRGRFYRGSQAFLHFHEDPSGTHADLKVDGEWERLRVATSCERSQLVGRARAVLGA